MRFDWHRFCTAHHIPFVTSGPNTSRGDISVKCPWCGSADPSEHLGLHLDTNNPVWGCLRNSRHRGRSPVYLVAKLLRISFGAATELVEQSVPPVDDFDAVVELLRGGDEIPQKSTYKSKVRYPEEFRRLIDGTYGQRFIDYLAFRGFHDAAFVAATYDLFYSLTGDFAWRLIFPVQEDNELIGWTGRDIRKGAKLRYRASDNLGKDVLLSFDRDPESVIVVVEGPLDALKIDYYGKLLGINAVATMGTAVTEGQKKRLAKIARSTPTYVVFDATAMAGGLALADEVGATWLPLPSGIGDPGEMDQKTAIKFLRKIAK